MLYVDQEFAMKIMYAIPLSEVKRNGTDFRINGRCPVCGDSANDKYKKRFWLYRSKKGDHYNAGCFNCNYNKPLSIFLKDYLPDEYREYLLANFKERGEIKDPTQDLKKFDAVIPTIPKLEYCSRLDTLSENHPIITYVKNRMIPVDKYNRLWFTENWQLLVNSVKPDVYKNPSKEYRLVIPIFNEDGKIESFQGRALSANAEKRTKYITIKASPDSTKFYGQDTIDPLKTVFILEGPLDSLFVDNSGAITGGQLALSDVPYKNTRVWVMDDEPRHPDTTRRMEVLIDAGEKIVLWDRCPWKAKDINDKILKDHATQSDIMNYLNDNIVSGLTAKLRFNKWKKI
ncbi:DNA primase [Morganella phage vB_Mm5]